ncbi:MAG: patatin-like phospholipase family protein [Paludibacter sp.]|jgi:NTE family protein|nr:patatin-like phospholipase family protein [Paludibacter sp.]
MSLFASIKSQNTSDSLRIGVCFSGGGALGFAHIGAIQALNDYGIFPDEISGASMGSIVGSMVASGYTPAQILAIIQQEKMYKTTKILNIISAPLWRKSGISNHNALRKVLREHVPSNSFEGLKMPLYISVTNLLTGNYEIISSGDSLDLWVAASASIPGIFENIKIRDNYYCDGGLLNNMPVQPLTENCNLIIGIDVVPYLPKEDELNNTLNAFLFAIRLAEHNNAKAGRALCDHIIDIPAISTFHEFSFAHYDLIYQYGYDAVEEYIKIHPELDLKNK